MGSLDSNPRGVDEAAFQPEVQAIAATDDVADSDRTPAMPSVIEVTPPPSAVDADKSRASSWVNSLSAKLGMAAVAVLAATTAVTSVTGSGKSGQATEIRPDNSLEVRKTYKNIAIPMMSKDGKAFQMNGAYEKDFNMEVSSPENPKAFITVKVGQLGKQENPNSAVSVTVSKGGTFEVKGKFEKPASQVEFKLLTLDGKEIGFTSYEEVTNYINQNPASPKPIIGDSVVHSMKGLRPDQSEVYSKRQE